MRITLCLLRSQVGFAQATLRSHDHFRPRGLVPPPDGLMEWLLFVRDTPAHDVTWFDYLSPIVASSEERSPTSKSAGGLLVKAYGRVFAVTFGTGFHAIDHADVEPDFGLKVTANCVADTRTLAEARGRGKGKRLSAFAGATPARSGNTDPESSIRRRGPTTPARAGKDEGGRQHGADAGTTPLARGRLPHAGGAAGLQRKIPARAGTTCSRTWSWRTAWDHPRSCGEDTS